MAVSRDRPYNQFIFLIDLGTGDASSRDGGFQEVSGLGSTVDVIEYRNGNSKENAPNDPGAAAWLHGKAGALRLVVQGAPLEANPRAHSYGGASERA